MGKIEGEREVQQACWCCVCEKICTTVVAAAAQFGSRLYRCAPHSIEIINDAKWIVCRSEQAT